jgi:ATP-binding cassette subfamily B protein
VLILASAVLEQVTPVISKFIVDEIQLQAATGTGNLQKLLVLIALTFIFSLIGTIVNSAGERLGDHFAGRLQKLLTEVFYHKVLTLPQTYFDSALSGKIVNQLNRGIDSTKEFINTSTNFILPTILQSVFTIAVLAYFSPPTALLVAILFPVYISISYVSAKKWGQQEVKKNKLEDLGRGRIQEVISNIKLVKSFINEHNEYKNIVKNRDSINKIYARQSTTFHWFDFLRNLSLIVILLAINIIVFINTFNGQMSIGEMVLIIQLVAQARRPLFAMSFILTQVQNTESGSKEFFEILELPSTEQFSQKLDQKKLQDAEIEFRDVSFHYEDSKDVLNHVSFKIAPHQKIALVGHSGAGKSTIINLILKFYQPNGGQVYLNGKPYSDLNHQFIRSNISLVFQENELFSSTIRENVTYGNQANEAETIKALKLANAYDFVMKLPKKLDSQIGERGIKLSGGQKQRIQIARAVLDDSPVLILDEATSSLDSKSEMEVQSAMENLMHNKTVIIIAHRFSTIQNVDRMLVLDQGRIVDSGTSKELSARKGIYADLLKYQIEGNKKLLENFEIY